MCLESGEIVKMDAQAGGPKLDPQYDVKIRHVGMCL